MKDLQLVFFKEFNRVNTKSGNFVFETQGLIPTVMDIAVDLWNKNPKLISLTSGGGIYDYLTNDKRVSQDDKVYITSKLSEFYHKTGSKQALFELIENGIYLKGDYDETNPVKLFYSALFEVFKTEESNGKCQYWVMTLPKDLITSNHSQEILHCRGIKDDSKANSIDIFMHGEFVVPHPFVVHKYIENSEEHLITIKSRFDLSIVYTETETTKELSDLINRELMRMGALIVQNREELITKKFVLNSKI